MNALVRRAPDRTGRKPHQRRIRVGIDPRAREQVDEQARGLLLLAAGFRARPTRRTERDEHEAQGGKARETTRELGWIRGGAKALAWRNGAIARMASTNAGSSKSVSMHLASAS